MDREKWIMPSAWAKRHTPQTIVQMHLDYVKNESERAKTIIPNQLDVPYGLKAREKIDVFGTDLDGRAPIFIFVHGGFWQEKAVDKNGYHFISTHLHRKGIKSIFVGYELCPEVTLSDMVEALGICFKKIINEAKQNESKGLYFCGHSAGGHLIATFLTDFYPKLEEDDKKLVKAAFLVSGIYDLEPLLETSINKPLNLNLEDAGRLSPLKTVEPHDQFLEIYVIIGQNESPEFVRQARVFDDKLQKLGWKSSFLMLEDVDHFDIIEKLIDANFHLTKLIIEAINN